MYRVIHACERVTLHLSDQTFIKVSDFEKSLCQNHKEIITHRFVSEKLLIIRARDASLKNDGDTCERRVTG